MKRLFQALTMIALSASASAAQTSWDMPTGFAVNAFQTQNVQFFADEVAKRSDGKLKIIVHPGASLYKINEIKRAVQTGQAQIGDLMLSIASNENPMFGIDSLPFLADSYEKARKLDTVTRPKLETLFASQGMKMLYTTPWQGQNLYSKKPINVVDDLKGTKMRAYNPATSRIAHLVGAQPTMINLPEMGQALAAGMVENLLNSSAGGVEAKFYEQISYLYTVNAWLPKNAVIVSQKAFDALDPAVQKSVLDAAAAAEERGWRVSKEKDVEYLKTLADKNMKIMPPSATLTAGLKAVGDKMLTEWLASAGPDGQAVIDAFNKL